MIDDDGAATATEDDDGLVIVVDGADGVGLFTIALNTDVPPPAPPPPPAAVSLVVLPRFLFANSYMSPNMPANVFLKFFIVSSASSATEVCDVGPGRADCPAPAVGRDDDETVDDCDTCESRRPTDDKPGAFSTDAISGGSDETLLRLPWRPIDPGPGVVRSGIGGGPLVETGRGADGIGGAISSVGLPPRDEIDDLETALAIVGRQTFCKAENCYCCAIHYRILSMFLPAFVQQLNPIFAYDHLLVCRPSTAEYYLKRPKYVRDRLFRPQSTDRKLPCHQTFPIPVKCVEVTNRSKTNVQF